MAIFRNRFPWRTLIYFLVAVYVFLDFKVINGPMKRKLAKSRPTAEVTREQAEKKGWVAIVNQEVITLEQLDLATQRYLYQRSLDWVSLSETYQEQINRAALSTLIDDTLVRLYADGSQFSVPQSEIDAFITRWEKQFPDQGILADRSSYQGLSKADRDAELAKIWTRKQWLEYETDNGVGISEDKLKIWYEENKQQQLSEQRQPDAPFPSIYEPEKIQARHIFVKFLKKTPEEAEAKIREAYKKLIEGEAFAELAKTYSEDTRTRLRGGDLNWFSKHRMPKVFAETVFAQELNQPGEPFQTDIGWYIVEVTERQAQRLVTYEEVKEEIRTYLHNEQRTKSVDEKIQRLRSDANITLFIENF